MAVRETQADLAFLLNGIAHALTTELTARTAELGITPRAHCVLRSALEGGLTQGQVAERSALDKTTMVVTLDELEREGLAERLPSSTDRRARIIAVTPAGEALVAKADRVVDEVYDEVLGTLPEDERAPFVAALSRLAADRLSMPVECDRPPRRRAPRVPTIDP